MNGDLSAEKAGQSKESGARGPGFEWLIGG